MEKFKGYGGVPRKPLTETPDKAGEILWAHPHVTAIIAYELQLEKASGNTSHPLGKSNSVSITNGIPVSIYYYLPRAFYSLNI